MTPDPVLVEALRHGGGRRYREDTDCVRLTFAVLLALYGDRVYLEEQAIKIWEGHPPYAPIDAVERLGIGTEVHAPVAGRWHLVQGWTKQGRGHAFFWLEPEGDGPGLQVQANADEDSFVEDDQTWTQQVRRYDAGVRLAVLEPV